MKELRFNILAKGQLIAQDYQRENGKWMHKWVSTNHEGFDKFSWRGKAEGKDMQNWNYIEVNN